MDTKDPTSLVSRGATMSAHVLAHTVSTGGLTASNLLDDSIRDVEERDGETHAFLSVNAEQARQRAEQIDLAVSQGNDPGPLAGVPVAVKDNICTRRIVTTCGSRILAGWQPPYDATAVERIVGAGGIVLGKTNLDEFGMGSSTENSAYGPTRNPIDTTRVPGGSSGGSAAAVAARYALLALGSDTGGSVRQPAALCGVVGLKPTYGRVSRYGLVAYASSLDTVAVLATDVSDAALLFDVISGHDERDSTSLPHPHAITSPVLDRGIDGLRVGLVREMLDAVVDPEIRTAVLECAEQLTRLGVEVYEVSLPMAVRCLDAYYLLACSEASSNLARFDGVRYGLRVDAADIETMQSRTRGQGFGAEVKRRIMLGTYALSAGYHDKYYVNAQKIRTLVIRDFDAAFNGADALLAPVTPTTAFRFGERADPYTMYQFDICTVAVNLAGVPAISMPFSRASDGMPIGIQLIGPVLGESVCFQIAKALEYVASGSGAET